jgi:hypothetical protein
MIITNRFKQSLSASAWEKISMTPSTTLIQNRFSKEKMKAARCHGGCSGFCSGVGRTGI